MTLTAIFVNSFRFYPESYTVVFRIYERLLTMPMRIFCEALGMPDIGEKKKKNAQTVALNTLLNSFCNTDVRKSNRQKISNIFSLTSGISRIILLEECWLETTRAALPRLILLSWKT